MESAELTERFARLTTPHVADACLRIGVPVRCAPAGTTPVLPGTRAAGPACPARHAGSVDVFLEAFDHAPPGAILVVDNGGRTDEACVGDLVVQEAQTAGFAGVVIWGLHRDTADIREIGLPVWSLGSMPVGPQRLDARAGDALDRARLGDCTVTRDDVVLADDDGVVVVSADRLAEIVTVAEVIKDTERRQATAVREGWTLRDQLQVAAYVAARAADPTLTFRQHLRAIQGAIEE